MEKEWRRVKPVALIVLDGFGVSLTRKGNAVINAQTPNLDRYWNEYPHTLLKASGESVGLPWGEYGNSEVGHITLGLGTIIKQSLALIKDSIATGDFFENKKIVDAILQAQKTGKKLHIAGIFSTAGVHGHLDYMIAILSMCERIGFKNVFLHLFTDGRDVPPQSFDSFWRKLKATMKDTGIGQVATVAGRFYSMDRISRWDRTTLTYQAMTGQGKETAASVEEAVKNSYQKGVFDEMIPPTVMTDKLGKPIGSVAAGDSLIFINHRRDRIRQIASFFASNEETIMKERGHERMKDLTIVSMVFYELVNMGVKVAFSPEEISHGEEEIMSLPRLLDDCGIRQYHVAETEKFPHVTYFFNGGNKKIFTGEKQKHIPSPKVRGYDEKPEMSLYEVTADMVEAIKSQQYGFFLANFANPDMVGHSGTYEAGVKAIEVVDECLAQVVETVLAQDGTVMVTADHGNCEEMINPVSGNISKEHSSNPVPFFMIDNNFKINRRRKVKFEDAGRVEPNGLLADVAPTVLQILSLKKAKDMAGASLIDAIA